MSGVVSFKLVLLGESSVGKSRTSLMNIVKVPLVVGLSVADSAAFLTQTVRRSDDTTVKLEIWDTAGQERYKSLAPMYYRNAHCAIVVYDITQEDSLENAKGWIRELQRHADANISIALVGNKLDLDARRQIPTEDGAKYAESEGLMFIETSAKVPTNVGKLFEDVANKLPLDRGMGGAKRPVPGAAQQPRGNNAPVQLDNAQSSGREDACTC